MSTIVIVTRIFANLGVKSEDNVEGRPDETPSLEGSAPMNLWSPDQNSQIFL